MCFHTKVVPFAVITLFLLCFIFSIKYTWYFYKPIEEDFKEIEVLERQIMPTPKYSDFNEDKKKVLNLAFHVDIFTGSSVIMEYDWISNAVFGNIDRPIRILTGQDAKKTIQNDTLHIFLKNPPRDNFFKDLRSMGVVNQGAYHMGDEKMINDVTFYTEADYVFRNYYNEKILKKYENAQYVPNGYKTGFGSFNSR